MSTYMYMYMYTSPHKIIYMYRPSDRVQEKIVHDLAENGAGQEVKCAGLYMYNFAPNKIFGLPLPVKANFEFFL